ncbi:MAG: molybdopterin molybdotransferase MoeA [bacterium]
MKEHRQPEQHNSSSKPMIPFEEARRIVDEILAGRCVETEIVPVLEGHGRVLAEKPVSRLDLPPFDKSAMDGYAVMNCDERDVYRVLEHIPAGNIPTRELEPGTAAKVMTGAPVPKGTGQVIMIEDTDEGDELVRVFKHGGKSNICRRGEDIRTGQSLPGYGMRLNALALANLVACGITEVCVRRVIRLAILTTGDEIVDHVEKITPGKIMDSNGPMLEALAREHHLETVVRKTVSDDSDQLTQAIREAGSQADIILLSGGVSVGDFDFVPVALKSAGFQIHFDRVAVKPGKPLTFATTKNCVALGLPGNPVSVFVGFHLFVLRTVGHLCGAPIVDRSFQVTLRKEIKRKDAARMSFTPGIIGSDGLAETIPYHGSAHLLALTEASGFLQIPKDVEYIPKGGTALFFPLMMEPGY